MLGFVGAAVGIKARSAPVSSDDGGCFHGSPPATVTAVVYALTFFECRDFLSEDDMLATSYRLNLRDISYRAVHGRTQSILASCPCVCDRMSDFSIKITAYMRYTCDVSSKRSGAYNIERPPIDK